MAEQTGTSWIARRREAKRMKQMLTGDSPERLAEHHRPKRDWGDMVAISSPGGQRHITPQRGRR